MASFLNGLHSLMTDDDEDVGLPPPTPKPTSQKEKPVSTRVSKHKSMKPIESVDDSDDFMMFSAPKAKKRDPENSWFDDDDDDSNISLSDMIKSMKENPIDDLPLDDDFDTLFSEPNNYLYYATYKDDTLIPIEYQSNYNRMVTEELDSVDGMNVNIGFDYGTHKMYPFNGGNNSIKAYTFTNDLIIKRCPLINANIIATKEYVNERVGNSVITVNNVNDSLTLTTDKNQYVTLVVPVEVILPSVTEYTEIHLFFNGSEGAELNTTNVKWESQLTIENNKSYEVVFTYVNDVIGWLAKSIIYN